MQPHILTNAQRPHRPLPFDRRCDRRDRGARPDGPARQCRPLLRRSLRLRDAARLFRRRSAAAMPIVSPAPASRSTASSIGSRRRTARAASMAAHAASTRRSGRSRRRPDGGRRSCAMSAPTARRAIPATLAVEMRYALDDDDAFTIDYSATTDRATIVNLTNHSYFNLAGEGSGDILDHLLDNRRRALYAGRCHPDPDRRDRVRRRARPSTSGAPHRSATASAIAHPQMIAGNGYDLNYVVDGEAGNAALRRASSRSDLGPGDGAHDHRARPPALYRQSPRRDDPGTSGALPAVGRALPRAASLPELAERAAPSPRPSFARAGPTARRRSIASDRRAG